MDLSLLPKGGPDPKLTLPAVQRRRLSNGLDVLVVEHRELPVVNLNLVVKTGGASDPDAKGGLAQVTADMLDEGTPSRSSAAIADQLSAIGASLSLTAGWDSTTASMRALTRHLDAALDLYADVITNPAFPEQELARLRDTRLATLRLQRDSPDAVAGVVVQRVLYGRDHTYGHPLSGDEPSLKSITRQDVRAFYDAHVRPNNAALIVVGDVRAADIVAKLEKAFASWKPGPTPSRPASSPPPPRDRAGIYLVDRPGSVQSVVQVAQVGVPRNTPDFFPLQVMNRILGGATSARLYMNLRQDKGYTYGRHLRVQLSARRRSVRRASRGAGILDQGVGDRVPEGAARDPRRHPGESRGNRERASGHHPGLPARVRDAGTDRGEPGDGGDLRASGHVLQQLYAEDCRRDAGRSQPRGEAVSPSRPHGDRHRRRPSSRSSSRCGRWRATARISRSSTRMGGRRRHDEERRPIDAATRTLSRLPYNTGETDMTPPVSRRHFAQVFAFGGSAALFADRAWARQSTTPPPLAAGGAAGGEVFWKSVRAQFVMPPDCSVMNAANLCPASRPVVEVLDPGDAHRRRRPVARQPPARLMPEKEETRKALAAFLRVTPDEIVITRNTSESNNLVSNGLDLKPGDEVIVHADNHPSNHVAWEEKAKRFGFTRGDRRAEEPASGHGLLRGCLREGDHAANEGPDRHAHVEHGG